MRLEGSTVTALHDSSDGDPFAPVGSETNPDSDDIKRRKLESARRAVDRRLKDERRKKRRARRTLRRVKWTIGGLLFLNVIAFLGLETPSNPLSIWTYIGLDKFVPTDAERDLVAEGASKSGQIKVNPRLASAAEIRVILEHMRQPTEGLQPNLNL